MASAPSEPRSVHGRLDREGRLVEADSALEGLQRDAGSAIGKALALPQVAAIAQLARVLGTSVSRPAVAASSDHDIELWVQATPQGDDVLLTLEGWTERPPASPRLVTILGGGAEETGAARNEWSTDEELRLIAVSADLAELLGINGDEASGQQLTRVLRLEEEANGEMPLLSALAARRGFSGQRASSRA
ncbi:MAG: PAS domain-containing sensor histidine kinase, partial [Pseudomonadota bacterium]